MYNDKNNVWHKYNKIYTTFWAFVCAHRRCSLNPALLESFSNLSPLFLQFYWNLYINAAWMSSGGITIRGNHDFLREKQQITDQKWRRMHHLIVSLECQDIVMWTSNKHSIVSGTRTHHHKKWPLGFYINLANVSKPLFQVSLHNSSLRSKWRQI